MSVNLALLTDIPPEVEAYLLGKLTGTGALLVRTAGGIGQIPIGPAGTVVQSDGAMPSYGTAPVGAHAASHASGGADPLTAGQLIESPVKRIQLPDGTTLTVGDWPDLAYLQRNGLTAVGTTPAGGGGGSGTATAIRESGGPLDLPVGPVPEFTQLWRTKDAAGNPRVSGVPRGVLPYKVAHPGVLENSDPNTWMSVNVTGVDACDLSIPSAVRVLLFIRYMASSPGIKFRWAEGAAIATWGGWMSTPGSGGVDQTVTGGDNPLDWGAAGWGHPNTRTGWIYGARDGAGPFTPQFAPVGTGTARINTGSWSAYLRLDEGNF